MSIICQQPGLVRTCNRRAVCVEPTSEVQTTNWGLLTLLCSSHSSNSDLVSREHAEVAQMSAWCHVQGQDPVQVQEQDLAPWLVQVVPHLALGLVVPLR